MAADRHRRQRWVAAGAPGKDVAQAVDRDRTAGGTRPVHEQVAHLLVFDRQREAPQANLAEATDLGRALQALPQAFGIYLQDVGDHAKLLCCGPVEDSTPWLRQQNCGQFPETARDGAAISGSADGCGGVARARGGFLRFPTLRQVSLRPCLWRLRPAGPDLVFLRTILEKTRSRVPALPALLFRSLGRMR